jgi:hypothetical protein
LIETTRTGAALHIARLGQRIVVYLAITQAAETWFEEMQRDPSAAVKQTTLDGHRLRARLSNTAATFPWTNSRAQWRRTSWPRYRNRARPIAPRITTRSPWTACSRAPQTAGASPATRARLGELFRKKLEALGLKRDRLCFHSFRHTVAEALEAAAVSQTDAARVLGHTISGMSYGVYSSGPGLKRLAAVVEEYPGLKLLQRGWRIHCRVYLGRDPRTTPTGQSLQRHMFEQ